MERLELRVKVERHISALDRQPQNVCTQQRPDRGLLAFRCDVFGFHALVQRAAHLVEALLCCNGRTSGLTQQTRTNERAGSVKEPLSERQLALVFRGRFQQPCFTESKPWVTLTDGVNQGRRRTAKNATFCRTGSKLVGVFSRASRKDEERCARIFVAGRLQLRIDVPSQ